MTFTYAEAGRTRDDNLPAGYRHVRRRVVVGHGEGSFAQLRDGMRDWQIHRLAGLPVRGGGEPAVGTEFSAGLGIGRVRLWVPCRVVWIRDVANSYGYGFGTTPGHPARGEEAFEATLAPDGSITFAVRAFSRPATWYARLGGPVTNWFQDHVTDRYVASARKLVSPN